MQAIDPELFPWCSCVTEILQLFALIERSVYFLKWKDEAVHPAFLCNELVDSVRQATSRRSAMLFKAFRGSAVSLSNVNSSISWAIDCINNACCRKGGLTMIEY